MRTSRAGSTASAAAGAPAGLKLAGRSVFYLTHVRTLDAIVDEGLLVPRQVPAIDVISPTARELRETATVPDGRSVADFIPFGLSQDASRWQELRDGAEGTHWAPVARAVRVTDFVILAVPVDALGDDVVFANADAAGSTTRFGSGLEEGTRVLRMLHATDPDFVDAELLVGESVPLDKVAIVTVANDKVRDQVREIFEARHMKPPRVAVFPPAFAPSED